MNMSSDTAPVRSPEPFVCRCGRFHVGHAWQRDGWDTAADRQRLALECGCGVTVRKTDGQSACQEEVRFRTRKQQRAQMAAA